MNKKKGPILITGSHRSGSTWVGKMIALSSSVAYIQEPFNIAHRPGFCSAKFDKWFTYVCKENESSYHREIKNCLDFKFQLIEEFKAVRKARDFARMFKDYILFNKNSILNSRPLVKDPIAVFSAEWLAKTFNMDVVILIRHPAAFAGSLKKPNWTHPFEHFLQQPLLMQHHLNMYRSEIEDYANTNKDIVDQAILLWNLIHYMILKYKYNNTNWIFVKHEDIAMNPIEEFGKLYEKLCLPYTAKIQDEIFEYSHGNSNAKNSINNIKRDSKSIITSWKKRLTSEEIGRVKSSTLDIASKFYSEEDWA